MNYKVGAKIGCRVITPPGKYKHIVKNSNESTESFDLEYFQIVHVSEIMRTYMIIIEDDMPGGVVSMFHVAHLNVPKAFLFRKFTDISECHVVGKK